VIIDDNIRKTICKIFVDGNKKSIEIAGKNYPINEISSIVDLKSELNKVAIGLFGA
jgi:hypothetical protein